MLVWFRLVLLLILSVSPSTSAIRNPANNVTLFGDASYGNHSIRLTQDHYCGSPAPLGSVTLTTLSGIGRAFYVDPVRFLDSATNATASFSSSFSFTITSTPSCAFGDGFAFLITSNMNSLSIRDGCMGLEEDSSLSLTQDAYVAVEFDTSYNPLFEDINGNHVGIDVRRVKSLASVDAISSGIDLKTGKEMTAWIEYRDSEKVIRVWVGYSRTDRPPNPLLVALVDLSGEFQEFMHVGFSASVGGGSSVHSVRGWRFKTFWFAGDTTVVEDFVEGDCMLCFPGDLNGDDQESDHPRKWSLMLILIVAGSISCFVLVVVSVVTCVCLLSKKHGNVRSRMEKEMTRCRGSRVPSYLTLSEIKEATRGFQADRIIGEGASAVVYEGFIPSHGKVAVKRFHQSQNVESSGESFENSARVPFNNEFATMLGCLKHRNLVQLQGWCTEKNELILVYEFMSNGSLDKILHSRCILAKLLTWEMRLNIVVGVASALTYLHEECVNQVIHRDVKTCNIMLDSDLNAKLGDFGLASVYLDSQTSTREASVPVGTMGYLAPEYIFSGITTVKSDVYSFGVVVLEVATGKRPVDSERTVLTDWVWDLWEKGKLLEAADRRLLGRFSRAGMVRMLMVGLCCVNPDHEKRPTVREASRMIQGDAAIPPLPPRKPVVKIQSVAAEEIEDDFGMEQEPESPPWGTPRTDFSRHSVNL